MSTNTPGEGKVSHTPTPWRIDPDDRDGMEWNNHIVDASGENRICFMSHDGTRENVRGEANAALIVRAVNAYEPMLAALKAARVELEAYEAAVTGETYNSVSLNAAIALAERSPSTAQSQEGGHGG